MSDILSGADWRTGLDVGTALEFRQAERPGFGAYLDAMRQEGFYGTGLGQIGAQARIRQAELYAPGEDLAELDEPAWRASEHFRDGVPYRPGLTVAGARALAEVFDENAARRSLIARREPGAAEMVAGFGAALLGGLPTPENFIPFAGPAMRAAQAQRHFTRLRALATTAESALAGGLRQRAAAGAGMGALDGFLGNLAAMPLINASRESLGDEVTWADMILDLAMGAAAGGVLGGGAAAAFGRNAATAPAPSPAGQDSALRGLLAAADDLARTDAVDAAMLPPDARAELERLRLDNARLTAALQPEAGEGAGLAARTAARPLMATGAAAPGADWRATTPAGTEIAGRYEVVELDSLVASNRLPDFAENPDFPAELQPRDRSTQERQQQVREIAARLRPEEVEASPLTTTGAPIVGPEGVVESGNGRTLAIGTAYEQDLPTAQAYRAFLVRLGFDDAAAMRRPVLVRRRTTEMDAAARRRVTEESNTDVLDRLTPAEQARVDARRLGVDVLALLRSPDLAAAGNADFIRAFIATLTGREARELSADGALTADGIQRVTRALVARAYPDADLVARLAQSPDAAAEGIGRALVAAAPTVARLRAAIESGQVRAELDAIPALLRAVQRIEGARQAGRPLSSLFDQLDAFDNPSPLESAWLAMLLRHPVRAEVGGVSWSNIADRLAAYARHATDAPRDPDMFGTPPPGVGPVLAAAMREAGLDASPELRGLAADPYVPPPAPTAAPPRPPEAAAPAAPAAEAGAAPAARAAFDPVRAAARQGLDAGDAGELAAAARLAAEGRLPDDIAAGIRAAEEMAAKLARAEEAWDAAAACAIRG